jgi:hypothetical protein
MWSLAPFSPVVALVGAALMYWQYQRLGPKRLVSPVAYALVIAVAAVVGYFIGTAVGISFACAAPAGNLCGLYGVFIIGPLGSAFAILLTAALVLFFAA